MSPPGSDLEVSNTGAALAQSGAAWAVAAGADGAPSGVATPVPGSAPVTAAVSATGTTLQNNVALSANATLTVPLGATPSAIKLQSNQAVTIAAGGAASAASGAACATAGCPIAATAPAAAGANAASGAANAQGVVAQNTVNTNANASVRVGGQNYAPITVIINNITQIFNWGGAVATTGDTTAGGGAAGAPAATQAASGSAQAIGAQVQNTVNINASAAVHVLGDNHNPIDIIMNMAASMFNWGMGSAQSGDAQSGGPAPAAGRPAAAPARPAFRW